MPRYLAGVFVLLAAGAAESATLRPATIEGCFVEPETPSTVRWKVEGELSGAVQFVVRDYAGQQVAAGQANPVGGVLETPLRLPCGFHDIEFAATKQRFGVVAVPAWKGQAEAFFAIDGALSWLVRDDAVREGLVRVAKRSGIQMIRERLSWGAIQPSADRNDWETPSRFDTLRKTCAKHGVEVLEMAHDGPAWMGRVAVYPDNLVAAAQSWQAIAQHWRPTWGGLEIWNEPDIFFGGNLPADQYVPLAKAIARGMFEKKIDVSLVGGVMAHCNREYLDTAAENGLLDVVDAFSFHTYGRAMEMEDLVQRYRAWLQAQDKSVLAAERQRIPLWLTECGRPWKKGPGRPPAEQDAESALDIIMKGVEARACGITRYFPFVYPYYEENDNNFGMMDKQATPLRSFAAYVQMIRVLAGSRYMGDLKVDDRAVQRARLFVTAKRDALPGGVLAVVYTGRQDPKATVKLGIPVRRLEGIDGRPLKQASDMIPVPDGLAYAWLEDETPGLAGGGATSRISLDTPAMRLYRLKADSTPRKEPSEIVMRYVYDTAVVEPKAEGYRIKAIPAEKVPVNVRVFNLSDASQGVDLAIRLVAEGESSSGGNNHQREIPARSSVDVSWTADVASQIAKHGNVKAVVRAAGLSPGAPKCRLVLRFSGEAGLMPTLGRFAHWARLPIQQPTSWTPNIAGTGKMEMDSTPDAAWRLRVKFSGGDRWVYPFFKLPDGIRPQQRGGLVIRGRCQKPAEVRIFLWEGDTGVGYITPHSVIAADGQWHVSVVRFSDLVVSSANAPDRNGKLDLDQVRRISVGMNTKADENVLELSDLFLVSEAE